MIFTNPALQERGIAAEYLITSGNEAGTRRSPTTSPFSPTSRRSRSSSSTSRRSPTSTKFKAACRLARADGKSIVALKLGQSEAGREAALAHTGSLAGSIEAFDAVAGEAGVIRADTLDDAVEITELLVHTGAPPGRRLGADHAVGRVPRAAARRRGAQRARVPAARAGDDRTAERRAHGRLAGRQSDRRRLRRAHQRRQLHGLDRRAAGRPECRRGDPAGGAAARSRLRPRRALHPDGQRLRRHQGDEADRVHVADLASARPTTAARCVPRRRMSRSCRRPTRRCAPIATVARRERDGAAWRQRDGRSARRRPSNSGRIIERAAPARAAGRSPRAERGGIEERAARLRHRDAGRRHW